MARATPLADEHAGCRGPGREPILAKPRRKAKRVQLGQPEALPSQNLRLEDLDQYIVLLRLPTVAFQPESMELK